MISHEYSVKVRWSEADPAGIVFYPRFFEWFDLATEALFGARFGAPVRYGDEVAIRSALTELREKTFRVEHEISVGASRCATGFEIRAWVAAPESPGGQLHAKPIPEEVAVRLKGESRT